MADPIETAPAVEDPLPRRQEPARDARQEQLTVQPRLSRRGPRLTTAGGLTLLLAVAGAQVWGRSGSAWMWVLVVGLVAVTFMDGLLSFFALRRIDIEVIAPNDAMVGRSDPLRVTVRAPAGRSLVRASSISGAPWVRVDAPETGSLDVVPDHRGVFVAAEFEFMVRAPLGLIAVSRRALVQLPEPVYVAPAPDPMAHRVLPALTIDPERAGVRSDELPRGVREYVPGDPRRMVNWPATARTGRMMVRDLSAGTTSRLTVVVDLGSEPGSGAERVASRAMGLCTDLLSRGHGVELITLESTPVRAVVIGRQDLGRRLAAARCGAPIDGPAGALVLRTDLDGSPS
ncbi:MAG: DUF58 domain-containing protein [Acidimicrobiia bacterium]